jgi:hypothetical protein
MLASLLRRVRSGLALPRWMALPDQNTRSRSFSYPSYRPVGEIWRVSPSRRLEAFHFLPRNEGQEERLLAGIAQAFAG